MLKPGLSKKQETILGWYMMNQPQILINEGAVRSGKTVLNNLLFYMHLRAARGQGRHYIVSGHTQGSVKRNVLDPLEEMFGVDTTIDSAGTFELFGNKVHCFGAEKADSYKTLTGMTADGWYGNEITLQHENSIQMAFSRISGADAWVLWDTNPDYPEHPIKLQHIDKSGERLSTGRLRVFSWHWELDDNEFLPADYVETLKASTPPGMWYDRLIKGLWVGAEGLVYELFDRNTHVVKPFDIPAGWMRVRAIDFGYTNPFVCLWGAVDYDGRLYIYDEHYQAQTLITGHADAIKRRPGSFSSTVADHDAQDRAELVNCGIHTRAANKEVELGIQKVAERLVVQSDGYPRLFISANCVNLIREFGQYAWEPRKEDRPVKEEPRKVNDHALDAARYMVMDLDIGRGGLSGVSAGEVGL
jgi:PBSX family phage terminase large subunit